INRAIIARDFDEAADDGASRLVDLGALATRGTADLHRSREDLGGRREPVAANDRRPAFELGSQPRPRIVADALELPGLRAEAEAIRGYGRRNACFHNRCPSAPAFGLHEARTRISAGG